MIAQRIETIYWEDWYRDLIAQHVAATGSLHAAKLLNDWGREKVKFWQIVPKEMLARLENPVSLDRAVSAWRRTPWTAR